MIDLKAWRTGHGMTQQQAADALGIGNSTVRAIEAGTREMGATLALACHGWDATHGAPAAVITRHLPDDDSGFGVTMPQFEAAPTMADLDSLRQRMADLEKPVRILQQRVAELGAAFEEAGLPLRQGLIPMTEEEAEEAELRQLKAQRLEEMRRAYRPAPGALTDAERAEAETARRAIAKARSLANGEPWE